MPVSDQNKYSLILEDGSIFHGTNFGADRPVSGEVVFNTGMTGYPESFTDPSYEGQIMVSTYPLIGNYGVPETLTMGGGLDVDPRSNIHQASAEKIMEYPFESDKIHIQGLIVADYSRNPHHWNSKTALSEWLKRERVPALTGIDTRALTKRLRTQGCMLGKIVKGWVKNPRTHIASGFEDPNQRNLVAEVSTDKPILYKAKDAKRTIVLIDCGAKYNIVRSLLMRRVNVLKVPWDYDFTDKHEYDGVMISNGPGDPQMVTATIEIAKKLMTARKPVFGICLGNQILALAAGAKTYKLKFGHRGHNQPCNEVGTERCYITSQNHGFAVNTNTLPKMWKAYFVNANDGTNEGIKHNKLPFFSVQFHPEASPGPTDTSFLFDKFLSVIK